MFCTASNFAGCNNWAASGTAATRPARRGRPAHLDRPALQEALEILGQVHGAGVAVGRLLRRRLRAMVSRSRGASGWNRAGGTGSGPHTCSSVASTVAPRDGGCPVRRWFQDRSGARTSATAFLARSLLGVIVGVPTIAPLHSLPRVGVELFRQAEVADLGSAVGSEQDIGGLQVAMDILPAFGFFLRIAADRAKQAAD